MTTPPASLDEFARQIAEQQKELEALRREYQARQAKLSNLTRRKQDLQTQLAQVEREIQAVHQGSAPRPTPSAAQPKKPVDAAAAAPAVSVSLSHQLMALVRAAGRPTTVKELADELTRRKFPTTSKDLPNLVKIAVSKLVKKGHLRRAKDQAGVVAASAGQPKPPPAPAAKKPAPPPAAKKPAPPPTKAKASPPAKQQPLRVVLTALLEKSKEPVDGSALARLATAAGYRSTSDNFVNVVWVMLGKMKNVEHLAGKGYRLKKR